MTQDQTLKILKTGMNVFITGEPGSGKSHVVNAYISWLKKHKIKPAVTASTGIAATHIGGMTIHSFTGIGIADQLSKMDVDRIASNERISQQISETNILIIDEVSMLSAQVLDMADKVCQEVKQNTHPFGGMQVILVGDFFQLPPVSGRNQNVRFAYESDAWQSLNLKVCYLSEQHRQVDKTFLSILSAIRSNSSDETHLEHLTSRKIELHKSSSAITKLFSHNVDVDSINIQELEKLKTESRAFIMQTSGAKALVEQLKRGCMSPETLNLKIGAIVMFTKNSPQGYYVNGTMGQVMGFDQESGYPIVKTKKDETITPEPVRWAIDDGSTILASLEQIPLRLAWAITVHKSQGMSMDAAVMDLSSSFEYGQGYVALSRVRSLSGLYLLGINTRALMVSPQVLIQDKVFRDQSLLVEEQFNSVTKQELQVLHEELIRVCGGSIEEQTVKSLVESDTSSSLKKSQKSWMVTLELIQEGLSLEEVMERRKLRMNTIFQHLEELQEVGKLPISVVNKLSAGKMKIITEIYNAIEEIGDEKLKPIFEHFDGKYDYDDIKIARLAYRSKV